MEYVHVVTEWDGGEVRTIYVFADFDDAQAFRQATIEAGAAEGDVVYDEQIIIDRVYAQQLIEDAKEVSS